MKKKILVVGLGYVGINIFYNFLKKFKCLWIR